MCEMKSTIGKVVAVAGWILLIGAGILVLGSYATIIIRDGWSTFFEIASPFNLLNWLAVLVTLAPGMGLIYLGARLQGRSHDELMR